MSTLLFIFWLNIGIAVMLNIIHFGYVIPLLARCSIIQFTGAAGLKPASILENLFGMA
jgi:hypothetical protein